MILDNQKILIELIKNQFNGKIMILNLKKCESCVILKLNLH